MADAPLIDPLLLSNFVHQIINPLNGVVGTLDNIIDGTIKDPGRRHQRLTAATGQLKHSIEMIRNLAFLSQLDEGQAPTVKETGQDVVIPALIIDAAQFFQEAGDSRKVGIHLTDRVTQYRVKGHIDLLRQVFINLFDNGVKYSDPGTQVLVTPREQKKTGNLIIEVESQGCKFDSSEKEQIFDRGYRGQAAKDMRASGTGIGLYICRRILERAHGATIEAECSATTGKAVFRLRFPSFTIGEPYVKRNDK
jgi:signal transduction histidine kinase